MKLVEALRISSAKQIAFVGAGGKTSALFHLARQMKQPVFVTATTHLAIHQSRFADHHHVVENAQQLEKIERDGLSGMVLFTGPAGDDGRTLGLSHVTLNRIQSMAEAWNLPLLIEADGSRQRPLKAPAEHEPALPSFVDMVVVVAGMSALGKPINAQWVHRHKRFAGLLGLKVGEFITPKMILGVLIHPEGGLKCIPAAAQRIALLNQATSPAMVEVARQIADKLIDPYDSVLVANLKVLGVEPEDEGEETQVSSVHERVAGIVLAAGASTRFGGPKQLLTWEEDTFVGHVTQKALSAGLSPVYVVVGAYAAEVRAALAELPVKIVENKDWMEGQGTSVRAGVAALPGELGSAIFFLVDQPQVPVTLVKSIVTTHQQSLALIVAPNIGGQRGNPVLFDRRLFPELMALQGDGGGRQLFDQYPIKWVQWPDERVLIDIDTPEEYERLKYSFQGSTKCC